jgi:hypothetical protein
MNPCCYYKAQNLDIRETTRGYRGTNPDKHKKPNMLVAVLWEHAICHMPNHVYSKLVHFIGRVHS